MLKIFLRFLLLVLAVAAGRFGYDKAADLSIFSLKTVKITGNWGISADSMLAITGLEKGKSIYKQDLNFAADRLMQQPGVIECTIKRDYISTVFIDIKVAEPTLLFNTGELLALSREGMVLPISRKMPVLPLVSGRKFAMAKCYDQVKDPDIAYAIRLFDSLMGIAPALSARLSEINFGKDNILRLYFSPKGTEVLIDRGDIANSVRRLSALADSGHLNEKNILDLRYGPVTVETPGKKGNS